MNPRIRLLLAGALVLAARAVEAQGTATLGIYDDEGMTADRGTMVESPKVVYLGIRLPPEEGLTAIECSIAGLERFDNYFAQWLGQPIVVVGSLAAPSDTTAGTGGINVGWATCQPAEGIVMRLYLLAVSPPQDAVLAVRRRYPPSNPLYAFPIAYGCDAPCYGCDIRLTGGAYTLNPTIAAHPACWGAIKSLYRRP